MMITARQESFIRSPPHQLHLCGPCYTSLLPIPEYRIPEQLS
jgi:hypothetical protein